MDPTLNILNLEDNPKDSELIEAMLTTEGIVCELVRVETFADFDRELARCKFDLIISDYSLPSFDGGSALIHARAKCPDMPFVFFSGTIGEELAVEAMREGATDYVLKQRPERLVFAVRRALREMEERSARQRAEELLRQSEAQRRQSQKLEAIGTLAGGIAHDFNNLLTIISGYSDLIYEELEQDHPLQSEVEKIRMAADRAASLTRQLLIFSRKQVIQRRVLNLNSIISNIEKMLRRIIGEDVSLVTHCAANLGPIRADPGQIEQVVMNLAVNARDAMPKGGRLTIETAEVELDEAQCQKLGGVPPCRYVMLGVSDVGCGMDAETRAHMFEPFFTTKPPDKGTGLGLATVYGIVKEAAGAVDVESEPGQGTTFRIYLPVVDGVVDEQEEEDEDTRLPSGSETLLLVEDEEEVRNLARRILLERGYTVLVAANGSAARRIANENAAKIDLLVTDLVLPEMDGVDLANHLVDSCPHLRVLYLSGYTDRASDLMNSDAAFIQKPFTAAKLARKVREVLDS